LAVRKFSSSRAAQVLRILEGRGLVTREVDPDDSRALRLDLTEPGTRLALEAIRVVEATDAEFFAAAGERKPVVRLLRRLAG
jgi:DNA-binding MarR family transcriptional regulator